MLINVVVKPNKKENSIVLNEKSNTYIVCTNKPAIENKANKEVIRIISEFFNVSKSRVIIKKGLNGRNKVVEIVE